MEGMGVCIHSRKAGGKPSCRLRPPNVAVQCRQISERPVVKATGARLNFLSASSDALLAASKLDNIRLLDGTPPPPPPLRMMGGAVGGR